MERYLKNKLKDGIFYEVAENTKKTMTAIKGKNNRSTEIKLRMLLVRNHISGWKTNYINILGKPDIYFQKEKIAIYIDGCFWHGCPICGHIPKTRTEYWEAKIKRNKERDLKVTKENEINGIIVLRFWEHELKEKKDRNRIIQKILKVLKERSK